MDGNYMICTKCSYFSQLFMELTKDSQVSSVCSSCRSYCQTQASISEDFVNEIEIAS